MIKIFHSKMVQNSYWLFISIRAKRNLQELVRLVYQSLYASPHDNMQTFQKVGICQQSVAYVSPRCCSNKKDNKKDESMEPLTLWMQVNF